MRTINRTMWKFRTKNWTVTARAITDRDVDTSFDETGETAAKIKSGEWVAFATVVEVAYKGEIVGTDSLWGSIYSDPREFFIAHRDADPMNRNCEAMRAARGGNVVICHYFPGMVRNAVSEARQHFADMPRLRNVA